MANQVKGMVRSRKGLRPNTTFPDVLGARTSQQQRQCGQQLRMLQKLNQLSTKHQPTEQPTGETIARPSMPPIEESNGNGSHDSKTSESESDTSSEINILPQF